VVKSKSLVATLCVKLTVSQSQHRCEFYHVLTYCRHYIVMDSTWTGIATSGIFFVITPSADL